MTDHSVHPVTLLLVRFAAMPELLRYRCKLSYLQKAVEVAWSAVCTGDSLLSEAA